MIGGLDGTVAVVTGGASGIGAACCRLLEASGATVHIADREGDQSVDVNDRTALDALASAKIPPSVNLKFFFEGEEEAGSPHLQQMLERNRDALRGDA